ncbi:hypothetical protein FHX05_005186 [Rhizobium sp. BK491]|nr:hypothetical protein [Rhizobium sp. BK491]
MQRARRDPARMKSIGEVSIAPAAGGISGILDAQGVEEGQPQELQHCDPKGKRDRLPPLLALRFFMGGRGAPRGGATRAPSPLSRAASMAAGTGKRRERAMRRLCSDAFGSSHDFRAAWG